MKFTKCNLTVAMVVSLCAGAQSQTLFAQDLVGFNAATGAQSIYGFDSIGPDTNIGGLHDQGMTFSNPGSPLVVVRASETFTPSGVFNDAPNIDLNVLTATSGDMVLSPGGKELGSGSALDDDQIEIVFDETQTFFGFDHLSQSADGFSFTRVEIYDWLNTLINTFDVPIQNVGGFGGGAAGGNDFWGVVYDMPSIWRVVISESDNNQQFPDANIGVDTIRYGAVPEPATVAVMALGSLLLLRRRR